jgi:hypothetical protein
MRLGPFGLKCEPDGEPDALGGVSLGPSVIAAMSPLIVSRMAFTSASRDETRFVSCIDMGYLNPILG